MCETITLPDGKEIETINRDGSCLCTNTNQEILEWIAHQVPDIEIGQKLVVEHTPFDWNVSIQKTDVGGNDETPQH
jgi:hypothetical protein